MSNAFSYKGKILGHIHSYIEESITKFVMEVEDIEALERLCRLADDEIIEINGTHFLYKQFKKEILTKTKRINLSNREYNLDPN